MNFDLSEEQKILKKTAHDFLAKKYPKDLVRKLDESDEGYSPQLWGEMAELGWMGLAFPEEYNGVEGSFLDLIILMEEMGYSICPGPFFSTVVLGGLPILMAGSDEQKREILPGIANGEVIVTLALTEPSGGFGAHSVEVNAVLDNGDYLIDGTKLFISDAHVADYLLCVATTGEGHNAEESLTMFLVDAKSPGIQCTPLKTLGRDKQCEVQFDDVRVPKENIVGTRNQAWPLIKDTLEKAAVARSAEMIGGAQAVMDMALSYAKERVQFDHPIGSFQAVQHNFANMWADINGSRNLLYKAAWKISKGVPASMESAMAKARVGEAYRRVTILGHKIFGGIGFTMEHDMHLYHKRSMAGDLSYGNGDFQRENVARELGL